MLYLPKLREYLVHYSMSTIRANFSQYFPQKLFIALTAEWVEASNRIIDFLFLLIYKSYLVNWNNNNDANALELGLCFARSSLSAGDEKIK